MPSSFRVPSSPYPVYLKAFGGFHPTELTPHLYSIGYDRSGDEVRSLIDVKDVRQRDGSECGPAAVMSVLQFYKVGTEDMDELRELLNTTDEGGTTPKSMIHYLESLGLQVEAKQHMTLEDLEDYWQKDWPVICCIQRHDDEEEAEYPAETTEEEEKEFEHGHYVVVIGVPANGLIYFQDPAVSNILDEKDAEKVRGRSRMPVMKWLKIWHDEDRDGNKYIRFGIAVGPPTQEKKMKKMVTSGPYSHNLVTTPKSGGNVFGQGQVTNLKIPMENNISEENYSFDSPEHRVKAIEDEPKAPKSTNQQSSQQQQRQQSISNASEQQPLRPYSTEPSDIDWESDLDTEREDLYSANANNLFHLDTARLPQAVFGLDPEGNELLEEVINQATRGEIPIDFGAQEEVLAKINDLLRKRQRYVRTREVREVAGILNVLKDGNPAIEAKIALALPKRTLYLDEFEELLQRIKDAGLVSQQQSPYGGLDQYTITEKGYEYLWSLVQSGFMKVPDVDWRPTETLPEDYYTMDLGTDYETKALQPEETKYSSTQFNIEDPSTLEKLKELRDSIAPEDLSEKGLEEEPHITIKYGLHTDDPSKVKEVVQNWLQMRGFDPVKVRLGPVSLFPANDTGPQRGGPLFDVLKVDVEGDELRQLNRVLSENLAHTDTHSNFNPHLTLGYLNPGSGWLYVQEDPLGDELEFTQLIFSDPDRNHVQIDLTGEDEQPGWRCENPPCEWSVFSAGDEEMDMEKSPKPVIHDQVPWERAHRDRKEEEVQTYQKTLESGVGNSFIFFRQAYDRWRTKPDILGERRLKLAYEKEKAPDQLAIKNDEEYRLLYEGGTFERDENRAENIPPEAGLTPGEELEDQSGIPLRSPKGSYCPDGTPIDPRTRTCTETEGSTGGYPGIDEMHIEQDDRHVGGQRRGKSAFTEKCPDGRPKPLGTGSCQGRQANSWDGIVDKDNLPGWENYPDYAPVVGLDIRDPEEREEPMSGPMAEVYARRLQQKALESEGSEIPEEQPESVPLEQQPPTQEIITGKPVIYGGHRIWPEVPSGAKPWKQTPEELGSTEEEPYVPYPERQTKKPAEEDTTSDVSSEGNLSNFIPTYPKFDFDVQDLQQRYWRAEGEEKEALELELEKVADVTIAHFYEEGENELAYYLQLEKEQREIDRQLVHNPMLIKHEKEKLSARKMELIDEIYNWFNSYREEMMGPWSHVDMGIDQFTGKVGGDVVDSVATLSKILTTYGPKALTMLSSGLALDDSAEQVEKFFQNPPEGAEDWLAYINDLWLSSTQSHVRGINPEDAGTLDPSFVHQPGFQNILYLTLRGFNIGADGVEIIADSPYLSNLKTLTLNTADIRGGVRFLINSPYLQNIEMINLTNSNLSRAEKKALKQHFGDRVIF